jgi:hypothetical protein
MSWITPKTWATNELVTAAMLNQELRDRLVDIWKVTTKGDILAATGANDLARLGVGSNDQVLKAASGEAMGLKWGISPVEDKVTTKGDILVATAADTLSRLGVGSDGQSIVAASGETTGLKWYSQANQSAQVSGDVNTTSTSMVAINASLQLTVTGTNRPVLIILKGSVFINPEDATGYIQIYQDGSGLGLTVRVEVGYWAPISIVQPIGAFSGSKVYQPYWQSPDGAALHGYNLVLYAVLL